MSSVTEGPSARFGPPSLDYEHGSDDSDDAPNDSSKNQKHGELTQSTAA